MLYSATCILIIVILTAIVIWFLWASLQADKRATERATEQVAALSRNRRYLRAVRSSSCYSVLPTAHLVVTCVAVIATGIRWVTLLGQSGDGGYLSFMCGAVLVALFLEYGLFCVLLDGIDVLIDIGRRTAEDRDNDAESTSGG